MGASGRPRIVPTRARRAPGDPCTVTMALDGPIDRADIPALCGQAGALLTQRPAQLIVCDVRGVPDPDAVTVDALSRLQLVARAAGGCLQLAHASPELRDLIRLMGLDEVLPSCEESALEPGGQAE